MKNKNKSLLIKAFSILAQDISTTAKDNEFKKLFGEDQSFGRDEKFALLKHFKRLARIDDHKYWALDGTISATVKVMNQAEKNSEFRKKKKKILDTLRDNRSQRLPVIFYICSYHEKCADGHEDYQGKIYVDRYWKSAIEQYNELKWLVPAVTDYIKLHDIKTVQEVTHGEPYLVTRPYCKHFFTPLGMWQVLTSTLSEVKFENPSVVSGTGGKSSKQYRKEYTQLRDAIRKRLEIH
jgi:hypothetical protein